ncbi:Pectin lyase-like protein [Glarea lozoyensis ATCC 20868]|uniref:Pectate lyase n=2 Tax=Glarea lozoyensis TaxID=101852 RepID=S3CKK1_GLAL2|nr:Pectin lyase-like protein [Glarea lozoyensis ATCC 20868]EHK97680.1 putative pectate lyase E [Glarea lozoyensis 74030]EPE25729.1 Pectin lyase-like protein [Glarea lozoyensis ATCC 20868]
MQFTTAALTAILATLAASQTLNIPARSGSIQTLRAPMAISGSKDMGNKEYDRGQACDTDADTGSDNAVFILENGATLSNVIIGANQLEGVHCKGACTLKNVWFRDVCEDAISLLGNGDVLIQGGGAQNAKDKVVQHNGKGTVTIKDYTAVSVGKVYRSCGNCSNNGGPRKVIISNLKANGVTSDVAGINSNYGDTATISGSCGKVSHVCQEFKGIDKKVTKGESPKLTSTGSCLGAQGKLAKLPAC